jgi:hypothetical protein
MSPVVSLLEQTLALQVGALVHAYQSEGLSKVESLAITLEYVVAMAETLAKNATALIDEAEAAAEGSN